MIGAVVLTLVLALGSAPAQDGDATGTVEVEIQEEEGTSATPSSPSTTVSTEGDVESDVDRAAGPLPRTGVDVVPVAAAGLVLLGAGAVIGRRYRLLRREIVERGA